MLVARIGDCVVGTCVCSSPPYPDIGVISTGDPMHIDYGSPVARIGDSVTFSCGSSVIVMGTPMDISGGTPVARIGDSVVGCGMGVIQMGSITIDV